MTENTEFIMRIADLNIRMLCNYPYTKRLCADFMTDSRDADMIAKTTPLELEEESRNYIGENPSPGYCESICLYRDIAEQLPAFVNLHNISSPADIADLLLRRRNGV